MALGPKDLASLSEIDSENVNKIELLIDKKLTENFSNGGGGRINIETLAGQVGGRLTFKMKDELEKRYEKVGWSVLIDGDFLVLDVPMQEKKKDIIPEIGVDEMLDRMREARENPTVKPPVINKMSRDNPENPYSRAGLNNK